MVLAVVAREHVDIRTRSVRGLVFWRWVDGIAGNGRSGGNDVLRKAASIFGNDLSSKVIRHEYS